MIRRAADFTVGMVITTKPGMPPTFDEKYIVQSESMCVVRVSQLFVLRRAAGRKMGTGSQPGLRCHLHVKSFMWSQVRLFMLCS